MEEEEEEEGENRLQGGRLRKYCGQGGQEDVMYMYAQEGTGKTQVREDVRARIPRQKRRESRRVDYGNSSRWV